MKRLYADGKKNQRSKWNGKNEYPNSNNPQNEPKNYWIIFMSVL